MSVSICEKNVNIYMLKANIKSVPALSKGQGSAPTWACLWRRAADASESVGRENVTKQNACLIKVMRCPWQLSQCAKFIINKFSEIRMTRDVTLCM